MRSPTARDAADGLADTSDDGFSLTIGTLPTRVRFLTVTGLPRERESELFSIIARMRAEDCAKADGALHARTTDGGEA